MSDATSRLHPTAEDQQASPKCGAFADLFQAEQRSFAKSNQITGSGTRFANLESDEEPWVAYSPEDRVGLALSGGGIRSATFNLGLLQGLDALGRDGEHGGILSSVHYLATVSGGGYIGGWYTRWRTQQTKTGSPSDRLPQGANHSEAAEVRHLREFSRFLSPRVGFFEVELWYGIVAILCGLMIGLLAANSVLATVFMFWAVVATSMMTVSVDSTITFFALTLAIVWGFEKWWKTEQQGGSSGTSRTCPRPKPEAKHDNTGKPRAPKEFNRTLYLWVENTLLYILPIGLAVAVWLGIRNLKPFGLAHPTTLTWKSISNGSFAGTLGSHSIRPWLFVPAVTWFLSAVAMLFIRFTLSRWHGVIARRVRFANERASSRLLGLAAVWSLFSLLWLVGASLAETSRLIAGSGAIVTSGLFALAREWIVRNFTKPQSSGLLERLKPLVPQALGYLTIGMGAIFVASVLSGWLPVLGLFAAIAIIVFVLSLILLLFDPAVLGLHAFYRDRIARAFLGDGRQTGSQGKDFLYLGQIPTTQRPVHLVCCAANGLQDDRLSTLGRCSRSSTLSCHGISIGNRWADWKNGQSLTLASALTASAAAFNSNMGSVSSRLGPSITFLMTALNLRLGLWVADPCSTYKRPYLPGWLYFREMFGQTSCLPPCKMDSAVPDNCHTCAKGKSPRKLRHFLHLSDGGHFENLALYELVRRHCRYIIVSDCGADPEVKFDDLGNAVRRIREDFGVDIEIDLDPLKPDAEGLSKQHMVVGTIHYNRSNDKGILLYFKPNMTGDEPADVRQYKTRNQTFPHEATGDQFYDEAQWESYRRLGEHAVWAALGFVERLEKSAPHNVFPAARRDWYPAPPELQANFTAFTQRYSELEKEIRATAFRPFLYEVFPELPHIEPLDAKAGSPFDAEHLATTLSSLLRMIQLMEDVCIYCHLDTLSAHPLNVGWFNLFQRWVSMPSFQAWWPIVRPLYGPVLRYYVEERLDFTANQGSMVKGKLIDGRTLYDSNPGLARAHWKQLNRPAQDQLYTYDLELNYKDKNYEIEVALVAFSINEVVAAWKSGDFVLIPGLWGAGTAIDFLTDVAEDLRAKQIRQIVVLIEEPPHSDRAKRDVRTDLIEFYASAGFVLADDNKKMTLTLPSSTHDGL